MVKRAFKRATPPADVSEFIEAAAFGETRSTKAVRSAKVDVEAQLHVLMPRADIVALKRAALDRGKTVSDLVRESVQVYINTK
jgi:hypothetical protein